MKKPQVNPYTLKNQTAKAVICITGIFVGLPFTGALLMAEHFILGGLIGTISLFCMLCGVGATYD